MTCPDTNYLVCEIAETLNSAFSDFNSVIMYDPELCLVTEVSVAPKTCGKLHWVNERASLAILSGSTTQLIQRTLSRIFHI